MKYRTVVADPPWEVAKRMGRRQLYRVGRGGVPAKVHSAKPDGFYDWVTEISPAPRVDVFARCQRLGWKTWGNECFTEVLL